MIINTEKPIIDSNILISFFTEDDSFLSSKEIIEKNGGHINECILTETLNFIQNKHAPFYALSVFDFLQDNKEMFSLLPIQAQIYRHVYRIWEKFLDNKLSFTDCLILAQAEEYNLSVITRDRKMQNYKKVNVIIPD